MLCSMCRPATKPKGNREETAADIIWPQKDSARGRSCGKTNWLEAINGRRQDAMEPGTFSIALEWLRQANGLRRKRAAREEANNNTFQVTIILKWSRINDGEKDSEKDFFWCRQLTMRVTVQWDHRQKGQQIMRWRFPANECGTERTWAGNSKTVISKDHAPAANHWTCCRTD